MTKLKPEIKKLWIDALLSGDYEQGDRFLNRNGKFCCLGVLCDLAVKSGVTCLRVDDTDAEVAYGGRFSTLPVVVDEWATEDGKLGMGRVGDGRSLAGMNDAGHSFETIAAVIKENF